MFPRKRSQRSYPSRKFSAMLPRCQLMLGLLLACQVGWAASGDQELLSLPLTAGESLVRIQDNREYYLHSATATVSSAGRRVDVYRFIISAAGPDRVIARLVNPVWRQVPGSTAADSLPPLIKVHSAQGWGNIRIVMLDVSPWRSTGGRIQVLRDGHLEVTIRHQPADGVRAKETVDAAFPVANRLLAPARRTRPALYKTTVNLPTTGNWLKISITIDGIYRLNNQYLSTAGLDTATIIPDELRLFAPSALGRPLSSRVGGPQPENLVELPRLVRDGNDGRLDAGDDLIFYARGPRGVDLSDGELHFTQNPYTDAAFVWLYTPFAGDGTQGISLDAGNIYTAGGVAITKGRALTRLEVDIFNGFSSGPVWHQTRLRNSAPFTMLLEAPRLLTTDTTRLRVRVRGGSATPYSQLHQLQVTLNDMPAWQSGPWSVYYDKIFTLPEDQVSQFARTGGNILNLANLSANPLDEIWVDWAELEHGVELAAFEDRLAFMIPARGSGGNVTLSGFSTTPLVLDITDPAKPELLPVVVSGTGWEFSAADLSITRQFIAAGADGLLEPAPPALYEDLSFTDLRRPTHKADYIVITARELRPAATQLAAIHAGEVRPEYQLDTLVVTMDEIYQEFSGGVADPYAIRAFLRYAYENWQAPAPRLVALFGDGDYDYRNISGRSTTLVPTIQVDSTMETYNRAVDDHFVYLDSLAPGDKLPDMAIGRLAVPSAEAAAVTVEQVRNYMVTPEPGAWRQRLVIAADDPVRPRDRETGFITDSDSLARLVPDFLQVKKIYLTEYSKVLDPSTNSITKPEATADLIRQINQGITLINYIGHGGPTQLSQEALLKMDRDRVLLEPGNRLPVWYAATCAWGRFDDLDIPSMSEALTASTDIGGIAVISATRSVYSSLNTRFVTRLFQQTFPNGKPSTLRLGEIFQSSRNGESGEDKFHLFGDPAIMLAFPRFNLVIDPVTPDTLQVLGQGAFGGETSGNLTTGRALVTVVDAERDIRRAYQTKSGSMDTISYKLPGSAMFRGPVTVSNGRFSGRFIVPKDISYSADSASMIVYAWSDDGGPLIEQIGA
ncbi:MAG: C25 family cysteine peptidase, partial [Candidatus Neomarinimicrobiota bacterium]